MTTKSIQASAEELSEMIGHLPGIGAISVGFDDETGRLTIIVEDSLKYRIGQFFSQRTFNGYPIRYLPYDSQGDPCGDQE